MGAERVYRLVVALGRLVLFGLLRVRLEVRGGERLPTRGPVVVAANHVSFLDFLFVGRAGLVRGRFVRFLCRHEIWGVRGVGAAMDAMRHVPVDRAVPAHAYLRARALLREGEAVCVFPEAGVSHAFTVRALMPGAAALALETGAPLVPVAVWGGQRLWPTALPGSPRQRPRLALGRRVEVRVGEPLAVTPGEDPREVTVRLGRALSALLEQVQADHAPRAGERATWHPAHLGGLAPAAEAASALVGAPVGAVPVSWGPGHSADRVGAGVVERVG